MASAKERSSDVVMSGLQSYYLSQPLPAGPLRICFLRLIFRFPCEAKDSYFEAFFGRYTSICESASNRNRGIEIVNHWQMANIVTLLRHRDLHKQALIEKCLGILGGTIHLNGHNHDDNQAVPLGIVLIELAASIWLMMSIGEFPGNISYDEPIPWEMYEIVDEGTDYEAVHEDVHVSLGAILDRIFSINTSLENRVKLPQTFTAAHLEQIGGIEIVWTSNLADHLLLKEDDTKLMLFHQVSVLQLHYTSPFSILPKTLVDETIRSTSLLIPPVLGEPNQWFQRQRRKHPMIDESAGVCDRLNSSERQIEKFVYWRDRLVLLKRTFDEAEPRNISQLWWDDRRKTQWFTFWVAVLVFIMTVFFGVIQSVAGIVQAWASVRSLNAQNGSG